MSQYLLAEFERLVKDLKKRGRLTDEQARAKASMQVACGRINAQRDEENSSKSTPVGFRNTQGVSDRWERG